MKCMKCGILTIAIASAVFVMPASNAYAHGHSGSHHSNTSYYYCGGHAAHTHADGICPYVDDSTTYYHCGGHASHTHVGGACPYTVTVSKSKIKKVQKTLNRCGYNCGTADGVIGTKTIKALKKYQRANGLTADGVIGTATLESLGLSLL